MVQHKILRWTEEVDNFLIDNQNMSLHELGRIITKKWFSVSRQSVKSRYDELGIIKKPGKYKYSQAFTNDEAEWLMKNYPLCSKQTLEEKFKETFGHVLHAKAVSNFASYRKLVKNDDVPKGRFGDNGKTRPPCPVGTERIKNGLVIIKYTDKCKDSKKNWIPKQELVYLQHYGEIPAGHTIVFLDGDRRNFDIKNLYAIPGDVRLNLFTQNLYTKNKDLTLAAIKLFELKSALKRC